MAKMYDRPGGKDFDAVIARTFEAQDWIDETLGDAGRRARMDLASHRQSGDARILTERGDVDGYLILDDTRGLAAAMSIEFGRGPGDGPAPFKEGTRPTWILHKATFMAGRKAVRPNSRRKKDYYE